MSPARRPVLGTGLGAGLLAGLLAVTLVGTLAGCGAGDPETRPGYAESSQPAAQESRGPLPDLTLEGFDGGDAVDLGELRGPAVINLWASWCGPCREEMPLIEEFFQSYGDQVAVLGIDFQDQQSDQAAELVAQTGVTYPLATDPAGELNGLEPFPPLRGLPFWALVDEDGTVVRLEARTVDSVDDIVAMVDESLGIEL